MKSDLSPIPFPNGKRCLLAKVDMPWQLQSEMQEDSDALLPSVLDRAFQGEL